MKALPFSIIIALAVGGTAAYYIYTTLSNLNPALAAIKF
jgi:hypothetical protein